MTAAPPRAEAPHIDPADPEILAWARAVARGCRKNWKLPVNGDAEKELEGVALLHLVELAARFDPAKWSREDAHGLKRAFRGYAYRRIKGECNRHVLRLKNGGTFHTRRAGFDRGEPGGVMVVATIGEMVNRDGRRFEPADPASLADVPDRIPDPVPVSDSDTVPAGCPACEAADCRCGRRLAARLRRVGGRSTPA